MLRCSRSFTSLRSGQCASVFDIVTNGHRRFASESAQPELLVTPVKDGMVALVKLNRPSRMNALSFRMGADILNLEAELPTTARAIVITGAGEKAFSTGRDLKDSKSHTDEEKVRYLKLARDTVLALHASKIPTVAAINGFAFGWGAEMSLACDLRVVYEDATLCFPETGLGIFPGAMGTALLPRIVGPAVAKDLILTARRFKGEEAFRLGLANRVTSSSSATLDEAVELAHQIAQNGPLGCKGARVVIDKGLDLAFEDHAKLLDEYRLPLNETEDFAEALQAFGEKRKPIFKGR